jgi:NAD(P)-dependent dehydrogenase (short-subunit alcohol dehydrogenase family)/acyl carrier protein
VRTEALPPEKPPRFDSESTYLITGATGGIGLEVVKWAVELGARNLTLVARRAPSESAAAELERLKVDSGATLSVHAADVSNSEDMIRVMSEIDASPLPLRGVFHVAGIFEDRVLAGMDWGRFERVLAPKVSGGWNLHTLTKDRDLDFFVLFSSGASFLAPVGLGNYSAANAFLDGLAEHRRCLGLPVASVNWGPWARTGMAEAVGLQREDQWTEAGFGSMPIEGALEVLGRVVGENGRRSVTRLAVLPVNWSQHFSALGHTPPMFRGLGSEERLSLASSQPALGKAVSLSERLEGMPADGHWDFLLTWVRDEVRRVLGFRSARDLDPDKGFFDLGMDSLLAVELKNRLQAAVGKAVSSTLVFDHPTVTGLAEYLAEDLGIAPLDESTDDQDGDSQKGDQAKVEMDSMSEDELAAMLAQKLKELE